MKTGVCVGGLLLSFGGWASDLFAQEGAWRPAPAPPVPAAPAPAELPPCPAAALGRPLALPDVSRFERPAVTTSGLLPVAYAVPVQGPPTAGEIPGGETLPSWSDVEDDPEALKSVFAGDRPAGVAPKRPRSLPDDQPPAALTTAAIAAAPPGAGVRPASAASPAALWQTDAGAPAGYPVPPIKPAMPAESGNPYPYPYAGGPTPEAHAAFGEGRNLLDPAYNHCYVNGEYLLWWTKQDRVPPLVTTSTGDSGILNQPGTTVLFGGDGLNRDPSSGFRLTAGLWFDTWCEEAFEVSGFYLGQRPARFAADSGTYPTLARPFFDVNNNVESAEVVAAPNVALGRVTVVAPSNLWGLEANLRYNCCLVGCNRFDVFAGFRYLDLDESLTIREDIQGLAGAPPPFTNAHTVVVDRFAGHNEFFGGQIGAAAQWRRGPWTLDLTTKLALGATRQLLRIDGGETVVGPNNVALTSVGGLLALPGNIGSFGKTKFSVVPEVGLNVGYQLTETIRVYAGYNFLYWTNVARPGGQIDRNLDVTKIPNFMQTNVPPAPEPHPVVPFKQADFWAQGIVVGLEFRY